MPPTNGTVFLAPTRRRLRRSVEGDFDDPVVGVDGAEPPPTSLDESPADDFGDDDSDVEVLVVAAFAFAIDGGGSHRPTTVRRPLTRGREDEEEEIDGRGLQ